MLFNNSPLHNSQQMPLLLWALAIVFLASLVIYIAVNEVQEGDSMHTYLTIYDVLFTYYL